MSQSQVQNSNSTDVKSKIKMAKVTVGSLKQTRKKLPAMLKTAQANRKKKSDK